MEALFKKVCKGIYPDIPKVFSFELRRVLSLMLQVKPQRRPTAEEILNLKEVKDKIEELYLDDMGAEGEGDLKLELLNTIKIPDKFVNLSASLPKPNYALETPDFKEYLENEDVFQKGKI